MSYALHPRLLVVVLALSCAAASARAQTPFPPPAQHSSSITDHRVDWPGFDQITRVLLLREHNTRVVVFGTTLLGIAAGVIGTFAYLRKRALMGDALSHATLPGIAAAFMLTGTKDLAWLITGATVSGILGVLSVIGIRRFSRLKEDAAIGIVLSVFFGAGMVLFSLIQKMSTGNEAGLNSFIYGKAAAMQTADALAVSITALIVLAGVASFFKELRVVCYDQDFAAAQGIPVLIIDLVMMGLVVVTTVIGLQAVGLIMIVALLIIPASAARFWTDGLGMMTLLAGLFGALSCWLGATISALTPRMPTGAVIVLSAGLLFGFSLLFSPHRGVIAGLARQWSLTRKVAYQNLLRAFAEIEERNGEGCPVRSADLLLKRAWSRPVLARVVRRSLRCQDVLASDRGHYSLSSSGRGQAQRLLRNHRLWETYLIRYADIAPSHVDRDADEIEHLLSAELIRELDAALEAQAATPPSPHLQGAGT